MKKFISTLMTLGILLTLVVVNPHRISASDAEWETLSDPAGDINEVIEEGVRYWELSSTSNHDNQSKPAIFEPASGWKATDTTYNMVFDFTAVNAAQSTRFSIFLFYTDPNNAITVGYDAGGWFWEYKVNGQGQWYTGGRVAGPDEGSRNSLEISLKDNLLIAYNTNEDGEKVELFKHGFDPSVIQELSEKSDKAVVKLGTYGSQLSTIKVKADDQNNIPEPPEPEFERPILDTYDAYDLDIDFENMTEENITDMFKVVAGEHTKEIVDFNGSKALRVDFGTGRQLITFRETPLLENFTMEADITLDSTMKRFGPLFRTEDASSFAYAAVGDAMDEYFTEHFGKANNYSSTTKSKLLEEKVTYNWKIQVEDQVITLFIDGEKILSNTMDNLQTGIGEFGFIKDRGAGTVYFDNIKISRIVPVRPEEPNNEGVVFSTLTNDTMHVEIDEGFPRVHTYTLVSGQVMDGQPEKIDTIRINDIPLKPEVTFQKISDSKALYTLEVSDGGDIHATLTAVIEIVANTLTFEITDIVNHNEDQSTNATIIRTLEIPNHSLVSVKSSESNANVMGSVISTNTTQSGDRLTDVNDQLRKFSGNYMYAFVSNDSVSAGIYSNSQFRNGGGSSDFVRVNAVAKEFESYNSVGLSSSPWIHHADVMYDKETTAEYPIAKVAIATDLNGDNTVNWQDGAIAFRDIMYSPVGAEEVKDLVAYRIAMTFGSHAQNPFLMTLDGIKKVNLHTDGLGQSILIKGYGSEGHDSGHLDYADIGTRIGGVKDFKYLLDAAQEYGASIGIHVNASETYPESKYFTEDRLRKESDGSYNYGWNWIDQGINIDAAYDLANGRRSRFEDLKEILGDSKLGWVYVDVWGNGQSGDNGAWASHQLAKEIHDQGWRLGGEWGYAFEPDSTFQHWAADLTYGGYTLKGINSSVARFIFNHQRDSWVADYPTYSGAADAPLLGGYDMKDFEGWQGRNDYNGYMTNLFETNIPTKFIQHFEVTRWVDGDPVSMKNPDGKTFQWTPEMLIELQGNLGSLVIERGSNDYANDKEGYRSRTMTLNGSVILEDNAYLLPWNWDESGNVLDSSNEKLYHFNKSGGDSTWTLPSDWNVGSVMMYELTETGNKLIGEISVSAGRVTLNSEANKAYVLYKGEKTQSIPVYGEGTHIVDPGFNTQNLDAWTVVGDGASVVKSQASNDMVSIGDNHETTHVSQVLTDLVPGESYVAYVGVDNRSDQKASIEISYGDTHISNYTMRSIAKNYVKAYGHNTNSSTIDNTSYFQNMFVYFEAPESGDVVLTLSKEAGEGHAYFDDIRITENKGNPQKDEFTLYQDFENNAQGIYPFVVGNIEGVEDNRTHLSQLNAPYTQRGWNEKKLDDVISGEWSVKTNGLTGRNRLVYQTIPQTVRLEPGQTYHISFDYEMGSEGTYALIIGDGEINGTETLIPLSATLHDDGARTHEFTIVGSETGQSWFGIYSTSKAAETDGSKDKDVNFRGYKDFMLDNLSVKRVGDITLYDDVSGYAITGSNAYIDNDMVLSVEKDLELKTVIESTHKTMDVDAFNLALTQNGENVVLDSDVLLSVRGKVRTQTKLLFFKNVRPITGVYTSDALGNLVSIPFTQEDESVQFEISGLQKFVIDYGKQDKVIDKAGLESAISKAETFVEGEYTEGSWNTLQEALLRAIEIRDMETVSQEVVDEALATLNAAITGLVRKESGTLDWSMLSKRVEAYKTIQKDSYTAESYSVFEKAYTTAFDLLERRNDSENQPTQSEIDRVGEALEIAYKGLVKKEEKPSDGEDLPKTGMTQSTLLTIIGIIIVVSGLGIVVLKKKRNE